MRAQEERYQDVIGELRPLYNEHWRELALNRDRVPLEPRWGVYDAMAARDELLVVTLRDDASKLCGYFIGFVLPALHYASCLELTTDIWRVLPSHRGHHGGVRLFREVSRAAKKRGCSRMAVGTKLHKDAGRLLSALGMQPVETYYALWLGD